MSQRQAIVLHHLLGMPVEEVAATVTIPTGTVKSRLARAAEPWPPGSASALISRRCDPTMLDLEQRLQRLAADGERLATAPDPQAAVRRGRRRRRRLAAGAALLTTVVVLAVVLVPAVQRGPAPLPVAPAPRPDLSPAQLPGQPPTYRVVQSAKGRVQIRGTWRGQGWRYTLRADPSNPFAGFSDWFEFDSGAGGGGKPGSSALMLRQCCDTRFRMPRSLRPALALGYVAYEQQPDMKIRNVELIDRSGRAICHQRFRAVTVKQRGDGTPRIGPGAVRAD